jgi:hypothetical protein
MPCPRNSKAVTHHRETHMQLRTTTQTATVAVVVAADGVDRAMAAVDSAVAAAVDVEEEEVAEDGEAAGNNWVRRSRCVNDDLTRFGLL